MIIAINKKLVIFLTIVIIVLTSVLSYFLLSNFLVIYAIPMDALWASVFVTAVLVVINIITTYQNRLSVKEMEKARKSDFLSHVRVELNWYIPAFLVLTITNLGKGPAIHIKAKIEFLPSKNEKHWRDGTLAPNESINIFLPNGNMAIVKSTIERIVVKGNYQDIFGQSFEIDEEIPVTQFIDETLELNPVYDQNKLVSAINHLSDNLKQELRSGIRETCQTNQSLKNEIIKINEVLEKLANQENYEQLRIEIANINSNLERIAINQEQKNQLS